MTTASSGPGAATPTVETASEFVARLELDGMSADAFAAAYAHPFLIEIGGRATDEEQQRGDTLPPGTGASPFDAARARVVQVRKVTPTEKFRHITIGRTPNNDLHLDDRSVSKLHCYLQAPATAGAPWRIVDCSTYGVMGGGTKLGKDAPHELPANAAPGHEPRVQIGDLKFLWYQDPRVALMALLQRGA